MCEPTTLMAISLAISAAGSVVAHNQQVSAANDQQEAINKSVELQNVQTAQVYDQQNQAAQAETSQRHIEWLREVGRLRTAGAESGLMGATNDRIENEATSAAKQDISTIESNRMKGSQQTGSQATAMNRQAQADLKSIRRPSLVGTGLQIAGAAVSAKQDYNTATKVK